MQMKKNYLLLFLMALLFGTANMRGQSLPWSELEDDSNGFTVKIGKGYLKITATAATCESDFSKLPTLIVSKQKEPKIQISADDNVLSYSPKDHSISINGVAQTFSYEQEGGKYYIKTPSKKAKPGLYLTNKKGILSLETAATEDAVVEIKRKAVGGGKNLDVVGQQYHYALALFQFLQSEEGGINRTEGPFIGTGLGQYRKHFNDKGENWTAATDNQFKNGNTPSYTAPLVKAREEAINGLKINIPTSGYFYVTTKSKFEDQVRENTKKPGYSNTPIESIPGLSTSLPKKYLKATAMGYELTADKNEAAVFYFDGHHLTGLDYGFGLGTANYTQTENNQKTVIGQGLLEKTLDAGSYSVKVGDQYVKLDRDNGLSLSTNESDSHLFLEEAEKFTLHTDALGYVSFYAPTAVQVPSDVKVYRGQLNASNTVLNFTEVNNKIPAKTAVLLRKGTNSKTSFVVTKIETAAAIDGNHLQGFTVSSPDHKDNAYGLTIENGKLVFKPIGDAIRAFRAVIYKNNAAAPAPQFILTSFAPTGIENVTVEENNDNVFDLTGRRVEKPVKGQLYIKNGKRFVQE